MLAAALMAAQAGPLSLERAIAMALEAHPDVRAAGLAEAEARARQDVAKSRWYPSVSVQEGWQRGNQPVFVFGSLLGQRRFSQSNFAVDVLNRPDPLDNFRAAVSVSQPLYQGGRIVAASRQAAASRDLAASAQAASQRAIAVAVTEAYVSVLVADAAARAAGSAVDSAIADEKLASDRRDAGMVTEADVLSLAVHRADMQARHIAAAGEARVARATLNRLIGVPLDSDWRLEAATEARPAAMDIAAFEAEALANRPDIRSADSMIDLAQASRDAARAALRPEVGVEGGYEWNGAQWATRSASWVVGVQARFSLSLGGAERAETRAAALGVERARAVHESVQADARLEVRAAVARFESAQARVDVARASVEQARESERIVRDRYEAGLAGVTDVLRVSNALVDATTRLATAHGDVTVAGVQLDRVVGRLPEGAP